MEPPSQAYRCIRLIHEEVKSTNLILRLSCSLPSFSSPYSWLPLPARAGHAIPDSGVGVVMGVDMVVGSAVVALVEVGSVAAVVALAGLVAAVLEVVGLEG